jgi:hypothetical protein
VAGTYEFLCGANRRAKHQNQFSIIASGTFPRACESSIGADEGSICASGGSISPREDFPGAKKASFRAWEASIRANGRLVLMFGSLTDPRRAPIVVAAAAMLADVDRAPPARRARIAVVTPGR